MNLGHIWYRSGEKSVEGGAAVQGQTTAMNLYHKGCYIALLLNWEIYWPISNLPKPDPGLISTSSAENILYGSMETRRLLGSLNGLNACEPKLGAWKPRAALLLLTRPVTSHHLFLENTLFYRPKSTNDSSGLGNLLLNTWPSYSATMADPRQRRILKVWKEANAIFINGQFYARRIKVFRKFSYSLGPDASRYLESLLDFHQVADEDIESTMEIIALEYSKQEGKSTNLPSVAFYSSLTC